MYQSTLLSPISRGTKARAELLSAFIYIDVTSRGGSTIQRWIVRLIVVLSCMPPTTLTITGPWQSIHPIIFVQTAPRIVINGKDLLFRRIDALLLRSFSFRGNFSCGGYKIRLGDIWNYLAHTISFKSRRKSFETPELVFLLISVYFITLFYAYVHKL